MPEREDKEPVRCVRLKMRKLLHQRVIVLFKTCSFSVLPGIPECAKALIQAG